MKAKPERSARKAGAGPTHGAPLAQPAIDAIGGSMAKADRLERADALRLELEADYVAALAEALRVTRRARRRRR
jgi:hypothetical protein